MKQQAKRCATAISLALVFSTAYAAGDTKPTSTEGETMSGKEKATAIGATTGAVAGAVVGGPIGAVVGAGIGGYVGHQGTDADGKVTTTYTASSARSGTIRSAQTALNDQGYNVRVEGQWGPNTQDAVRRFQAERSIPQTGTPDDATRAALGVNR